MNVRALGLLALLGTAALTSLGIWQLERLAWKRDLIHRVSQRVHAAPVAAPGPADWPFVNAASYEYRHVSATGQFLNDRETYVAALTELGGGFWVVTPFRTVDGFTLLVNRGFVPPERRNPATRAAARSGAQTVITGLLRLSEPNGAFLRPNVPPDRWYSRDVTAISAARHLSNVAPYFVDADAAASTVDRPIGGLTVIAFPNNHLCYALTWFALALMLAGASVFVGHNEWRLRKHQQLIAAT